MAKQNNVPLRGTAHQTRLHPPQSSEAQAALDDLARVFWDAALAELEAEMDKAEGKPPASTPPPATACANRKNASDSAPASSKPGQTGARRKPHE
jgi:hypothetical protein